MISYRPAPRNLRSLFGLTACALGAFLALPGAGGRGQQPRVAVLRIGTCSTMTGDAESPREKAAAKTLRGFIKDETGLNNEVLRRDNWQEVADELARGRLHLALFQGYEFAWAQELLLAVAGPAPACDANPGADTPCFRRPHPRRYRLSTPRWETAGRTGSRIPGWSHRTAVRQRVRAACR